VPMFLTALGLAWILGRQAGVDGMALGLGGALVLALGLWWYGQRQGKARAWLPLAPLAAAALATLLFIPTSSPEAATTGKATLAAEPFSEARLAALQQEGRPVFLYFTADWCITCKVNEKGVLARDEVAQGFDAANVAVLMGDWTGGDAAIGRFLQKHGRSGVPLYLFYEPGRPVRILPQILTVGTMTQLVEP
jgi:thiol:disulfide interchange protein